MGSGFFGGIFFGEYSAGGSQPVNPTFTGRPDVVLQAVPDQVVLVIPPDEDMSAA